MSATRKNVVSLNDYRQSRKGREAPVVAAAPQQGMMFWYPVPIWMVVPVWPVFQ